MPDKYKYVSMCKKGKLIRTNHRPRFIMHVASCPTCRRKLSKSSIEELQPELSQLMDKHIMRKDGASRVSEEQKAQLDVLIRDTQSFQHLAEFNLKLLEQFNCFKKEISAEMKTFGMMLDRKLQEEQGGWPNSSFLKEKGHKGRAVSDLRPHKAPGPFEPDRLPPHQAPYQEPPIPDPSPASLPPDLNTAEEFVAMENYLETQKKRLAAQGIIPALPEGVRAGNVIALTEKVIDFSEKWIDKIEIGLTLRKNKEVQFAR